MDRMYEAHQIVVKAPLGCYGSLRCEASVEMAQNLASQDSETNDFPSK